MRVLVIDSETTGFNDPQAIEIAFILTNYPELANLAEREIRFRPTKPIDFGAKAVCHILESELKDEPEWGGEYYTSTVEYINSSDYLIGQNIDFDWRVLGSDIRPKRICTLAIARKLLPELDSHSQSALMYYFFGDAAKPMIKDAHNALCDVQNCILVLRELLKCYINSPLAVSEKQNINTIEDLWLFSEWCRIPDKMTFGKHKGKTYLEVAKTDPGYFSWWQNKSDTKPDEYQLKAIENAMRSR